MWEYSTEWRKKKNECRCGGRYTTNNVSKHRNSKKHQNYLILNPTKPKPSTYCDACSIDLKYPIYMEEHLRKVHSLEDAKNYQSALKEHYDSQ
jgi:hypothetical protein